MIDKLNKYYLFLTILFSGVCAHAQVKDSAVAQTGFIKNNGQWDNQGEYLLSLRGAEVYFESRAFQYFFKNKDDVADFFDHRKNPHLLTPKTIRQHAVRMEFSGSSPVAAIKGEYAQKHHLNFITGNDQKYWKSGVPVFDQIFYRSLYPGVDAKVFQGTEKGLKYEFYIAAHSDPAAIKMNYSGAERIYLKNGNLHISTSVNNWTETKPYAYQRINSVPKEVKCRFVVEGNTISFQLGEYDKNEVLVIDPELIFSTYSGSTADNFGHTATFDNNGNLYTAGIVETANTLPAGKYPVTAGAFQTTWGGGSGSFPCDIAISKYNNDGSQLMYATYLGGDNNDFPISLVVDANEQLILLGATLSANFPVSSGGYDKIKATNFDAVITRFTADGGSLVGSTFFGGNGIDGLNNADTLLMNYADEFRGEVLVTTGGDVVFVSSTTSTDLATSTGAFQPAKSGMQDGVIARFDSALTSLKYCTYFGKSRHDALYSLDIDNAGNFVIAGGTQSNSFTPTPGAAWANYKGGIAEGFVARINSTLTTTSAMRYWGSPGYDQAYFVKLDPQQNIVVMGQTYDSVSITPGMYKTQGGTIFITKFTPNLADIVFSTQVGNGVVHNALSPSAFMVDVCGRIYGSVWGGPLNVDGSHYASLPGSFMNSTTNGLPFTADALQKNTDGKDFWLFSLSPAGDNLDYATFFGENGGGDHVDGGTSRFDKRGIIYQSVCSSCDFGPTGTFPTTPGSYSPNNHSPRCSNASFKIDFRQGNLLTADFSINPRNGCTDSVFVFRNKSHNGTKFYWYLDNVLVDTAINADSSYRYTKVITLSGNHKMKLVVIDSLRCNIADSITKTFSVLPSSAAAFSVTKDTCSSLLFFKNLSIAANNEPVPFTWYFGDGNTSKVNNPVYRYADKGTYLVKLITSEGGQCADTAYKLISYDSLQYKLKADYDAKDTLRCEPTRLAFTNTGSNGQQFRWYVNGILADTSSASYDTIVQKGTYHVKLTVYDPTTCVKRDSLERTFYVFPETFTDFDWKADSCIFGVQFSNQSIIIPGDTATYFWEFGDGTFSTDSAPFHKYADTGTYMVGLTANKQFPCAHTMYKQVKITPGSSVLHAGFTITPDVLCEPDAFVAVNKSYNASKSYWHIGGAIADSMNVDFTDSIKHDGLTQIMLVVYNEFTCSHYDTAVKTLTSFPSAQALFSLKRDTCSANVIITNLSTSRSQAPVSYLWQFGDGNTSTDQQPVHQYADDGTYTVTLITNSGTPCSDTASKQINYRKNAHLLSAGFVLTDSSFCAPAFIHASSNGINGKQFYWLLNNVLVSTDTSYDDTLATEGDYSIRLVVVDSSSCALTDTVEKFVHVIAFAKAGFEMQRDSCSLEVQFRDLSQSNAVPFIWYFGDGDSSREHSPKHIYRKTDKYTVSLIYGPGTSCADTAQYTYLIDGDSAEDVKIPNVFTPNGDGVNDCYHVTGVSEKCDEFYIKVYNRWGNVVYENTNGNNCWNGKSQSGTDLPQGVYYYILIIKKQNGYQKNDHGTITLIRE